MCCSCSHMERHGIPSQIGSVQILSEPQFPCLYDKVNRSPSFIGLLGEASDRMLAKHLTLYLAQDLLLLITVVTVSPRDTHHIHSDSAT